MTAPSNGDKADALFPISNPNRAEGDVDLIVQRRFFNSGRHGVMVEVGAARPDYLSVGAHYRRLGWSVLSIEPNPAFAALHRSRGHDVLEYACGDEDRDDTDFLIADSHGIVFADEKVSYESFSSLALKENYEAILPESVTFNRIKVKLRRLDTILATHTPEIDAIDILCVDVEGWEIEVLSGVSFERYRPKILIIENIDFDPSYRKFMSRLGYMLWRTIEINEVYASRALLDPVERVLGLINSAFGSLRRSVRAKVAAVRTTRLVGPARSRYRGRNPSSYTSGRSLAPSAA